MRVGEGETRLGASCTNTRKEKETCIFQELWEEHHA